MPIVYNGRSIEALILQNADGRPGDGLDVSGYLVEGGLGDLGWEVDEELTRLTLGTLAVTLTDGEGYPVWSFISNNLSSASGILPPWFILSIDGVQKFLGLIKEAPRKAESGDDLTISFVVTSWASMLDKKRITLNDPNWTRALPQGTVATSQGVLVRCSSVKNKELRRTHDRNAIFLPPGEEPNFQVGDWVYVESYGGFTFNKFFVVIGKQLRENEGPNLCLYLGSGFWWQEQPSDPQNYRQYTNVYKVFQSTSAAPAYIVDEDFDSKTDTTKAKTTLKLNLVDGLLPGDKLEKVTNYLNPEDTALSITMVDVDPVTKTVYLDKALNGKLIKGVTSLLLSEESMADAVFVPVTALLERAVLGLGAIDYSCWELPTLPSPALSFVGSASPSTQNARTERLSGPQELQVGLGEVEVMGTNGAGWSGHPDIGWATKAWAPVVNWTEQRETAPALVMPQVALPGDTTTVEEPRNRTKLPHVLGTEDDPNPFLEVTSSVCYRTAYDYSNMRYYRLRYNGAAMTGILVQTWNGATWQAVSGFGLSGGMVAEILPFKDCASSVGGGYGLLALMPDNTVKTFLSTVNLSCALPPEAKAGVSLKLTPNGIYFLTATGYGKIFIAGGALKYKYVQVFNPNKIQSVALIGSTFVYAYGRVMALAKASYKEKLTDERWTEDTYLFQLNAEPQDKPSDSVISFDFICKNIPRVTQAVRCPNSNAVMGLMGSRIFVISDKLPATIERISTKNKTASSLIEYACTVTNSVAIPNVAGGLRLVTRGFNSAPLHISVPQVSVDESRWNKHLCNVVVVKGADKDTPGVAVSTTQLSGITISYTNEAFIRNSSQARAIAQSYLAFFEKQRREQEQTWVDFVSREPVWESIPPFQVLTINDDPREWYLTALNYNLETLECKVSLLEVKR